MMAPTESRNDRSGTAAPVTPGLFEAFPEPRAWALNWDGSALGRPARAPTPPGIKVRFVRRG